MIIILKIILSRLSDLLIISIKSIHREKIYIMIIIGNELIFLSLLSINRKFNLIIKIFVNIYFNFQERNPFYYGIFAKKKFLS